MNIKFPDLTYIVVNISWYLLHDFSEWDVFVPLFGGKCGQGGGGNSSPYYPPTQVHSNFTLFGGMCGQGGGGNSPPYYPPTPVHSNFTLFRGKCSKVLTLPPSIHQLRYTLT